jgi:hypothetical protein
LFDFYFEKIKRLALQKLQAGNRRASDEEDLALEILGDFLVAGRAGQFPDFRSREDVLRMLSARAKQRAINVHRDSNRQKRGGGSVQGESALVNETDGTQHGGLDGLSGDGPRPEDAVIEAEEIEALNSRLKDCLGEPLFPVFELWKDGHTAAEITGILKISRATVYRKLELIDERLREVFAQRT